MNSDTVEVEIQARAEEVHEWMVENVNRREPEIPTWRLLSEANRDIKTLLAALRSRGSTDRAVVEAALEHARQLAARFTGLIPPERPAALVIVGKIDAHLVEILDFVRGSSDTRLTEALTEIANLPEPLGPHNSPAAAQCNFLKDIARFALAAARADAPQEQQA